MAMARTDKEERLAAALRENLRRRKTQNRESTDQKSEATDADKA